MGFSLESLHLYRKIPRDLTDATRVGGLISIVCAALMAYLFVTNISEYMSTSTTTDVALDETGQVQMRVFFNVTMERLPCQFASVDVSDVMGTTLTNVSKDILKFKVAPDAGHRSEFYVEDTRAIGHEELNPEEAKALVARQEELDHPTALPRLRDDELEVRRRRLSWPSVARRPSSSVVRCRHRAPRPPDAVPLPPP